MSLQSCTARYERVCQHLRSTRSFQDGEPGVIQPCSWTMPARALTKFLVVYLQNSGEPITIDFGNAIVVDSKKRKGFKGGKSKFRHVLGRLVSEKTFHFWIDCEAEKR
ncbi:hypothetical protein M405DRAFT_11583 [Rhizopogon salebrosus TDB-379]|nr:hypothetical protein M405DRAFT_11583 [Rhizopogon salebrosus TDB-379]